jgi:phospholipid-binding lipoprotein MlaA
MKLLRIFIAAMALLALAGCATVKNPNPRDPWEPFNRGVMEFNDNVDAVVLKPVATVYRERVPPLVRTGVSNFFGNLSDLWSAANSLLQLNVPNAMENFMRFNVNTFFGLGGILDIASDLNIERHREDFGQTLGRWGVPTGPYLVLPLMGPSTLRDALALPVDRRHNLLQQFDEDWRFPLYSLRAVDDRANLLRATSVLEGAALDKYSFTRDAHLQRRRAEIFEREGNDPGAGQEAPVPPNPTLVR